MASKKARRTRKGSGDPVADLASEVVKKYAAKQQIRIRLTKDQMDAILKQWDEQNPLLPAEITFYAGRKAAVNVKVAGYRYRGNTCCV